MLCLVRAITASNLSRGKTTCVIFILMHSDSIKCRVVRRSQAFPCALGWMVGRGRVSDLSDSASTTLLQEVLRAQIKSSHFRNRAMNLCNPVLGYFSILEEQVRVNSGRILERRKFSSLSFS